MAGDIRESKATLEKSLGDLSIQTKKPDPDISRLAVSTTKSTKSVPGGKKKKAPVADSWEDEISSDEVEDGDDSLETGKEEITEAKPDTNSLAAKVEGPLAPPSTPSTYFNSGNDTYDTSSQWERVPSTTNTSSSSSTTNNNNSDMRSPRARPEKQTAVASRMIAGALGIRAPKRTEEQRAYDRAMKEKEMKRRNKEKEEEAKAKQDEERAKAAIWDS